MKQVESMYKMGHEQVLFCQDHEVGLQAIIAIHDTTLGPALGGCRFWNYSSIDDALFDVLRLSRGMTYKASVAGLHLGGGKSVIIGDPTKKTPELFRSFGRFIQGLSGRYITAEDVNVRVKDISEVIKETKYAAGVDGHGGSGDPSPLTALGVFSGIRASVQEKLGKSNLKGLRVAVQGIGAVGWHLCELLKREGVSLIVADVNEDKTVEASKIFGAEVSTSDTIHKTNADVFAPCALGAILTEKSISELKVPVIAGAANNQLLDEKLDSERLKKRDILYAPDYVINAGGLINVAHELSGYKPELAKKDAENVYNTLLRIYSEAKNQQITTVEASNFIAEKRIADVKKTRRLMSQTFDNQAWIKK